VTRCPHQEVSLQAKARPATIPAGVR